MISEGSKAGLNQVGNKSGLVIPTSLILELRTELSGKGAKCKVAHPILSATHSRGSLK